MDRFGWDLGPEDTQLWRTIKGIDGRAKCEAENEAITFNRSWFSSSKQLAARFNQQFNTSKLGRHISSGETSLVTMETKRKSLEMTQTFTADLVRRAIKSCRNRRAIEYNTALFKLSVTACQIPAISKSSLIIPILHIGLSRFSSQPRKCWSLWICLISINISNLHQTNTVLRHTNRPPQLCCSWHRNVIQPGEAPRSNDWHSCRYIGCVWHSLP